MKKYFARWKKKSELELGEVFKDETSSSISITLDTLRSRRNDLKKVPLSDTQIQDKLQCMQSKKRRVELHKVDEEDFIPSAHQKDCSDLESSDQSVASNRVKYSQNKEELIVRHFEKYIFNVQALLTKSLYRKDLIQTVSWKSWKRNIEWNTFW